MNSPGNGDHNLYLLVSPPDNGALVKRNLTLRFRNGGATSVIVDGWIGKGKKGLTFRDSTEEGTLTVPGTGRSAITVANYTGPSGSGCESGLDIHETSSRGPVRGAPADNVKPTIAAPGTNIDSAKPSGTCCGDCPDWLENHY
jgi:hypothetical protein